VLAGAGTFHDRRQRRRHGAPPTVTLLRSTMLHQSRTTLGLRAAEAAWGITIVQPLATGDKAPTQRGRRHGTAAAD